MKTSELIETALDWAVAKCADLPFPIVYDEDGREVEVSPSTNWAQGGAIIERERIEIGAHEPDDIEWVARDYWKELQAVGPTPLIAAMRCYVASRLGDEVDVPNELI